uniref:Uncharacterized protein n=1 Tax=Rhipicephalus zambeziensis TaxID=60191 RepID=A0A224YFS9_9ACAR
MLIQSRNACVSFRFLVIALENPAVVSQLICKGFPTARLYVIGLNTFSALHQRNVRELEDDDDEVKFGHLALADIGRGYFDAAKADSAIFIMLDLPKRPIIRQRPFKCNEELCIMNAKTCFFYISDALMNISLLHV